MKKIDQKKLINSETFAENHEFKWLDEYINQLKKGKHWDKSFIDYECYQVFIEDFNSEILNSIEEYKHETGRKVSFEDAAWVLFYITTERDHRLFNQYAEA